MLFLVYQIVQTLCLTGQPSVWQRAAETTCQLCRLPMEWVTLDKGSPRRESGELSQDVWSAQRGEPTPQCSPEQLSVDRANMQLPQSCKLQLPLFRDSSWHQISLQTSILQLIPPFQGQKGHPQSNLYIILVNYTVHQSNIDLKNHKKNQFLVDALKPQLQPTHENGLIHNWSLPMPDELL